jgi:hypothetical protein
MCTPDLHLQLLSGGSIRPLTRIRPSPLHAALRMWTDRCRGWACRLSPPPSHGAYNKRSFAATGRGWRHPPSTGRRPAPGIRARRLEIREARCDRFPAERQQWAEPGDRREAHGRGITRGEIRRVSPQPRPQRRSGTQIAVTRVPKRNPWGRETAPFMVAE